MHSTSLDEAAAHFSEQVLPNMMRRMFRNALRGGLRQFDVDADTTRQLWDELSILGIDEQMQGLATYVGAVVDGARLLDDMDWNALLDESRQDSFGAFLASMDDAINNVQVAMGGLDQMTLLERAQQAQTVEQLITQARAAEIQMLRQIDQLSKSINQGIDNQIEQLRTGGMSEGELQRYYSQQVESIMRSLRLGEAGSPEQLQQMMADLQRYIGLYSQALGDDLYAIAGPGGNTMSDVLIAMLEEARGLSDLALEEMRGQVQEQNEALMAQLEILMDSLTNFHGEIVTAVQEPTQVDFTGTFDIHVHPNENFEVWVDARIDQAMARSGYHGPN
jgi:hypothetical protein